MKILGVKHSGQLGDIVYSLSFIRAFLKKNAFDTAVIFVPSDKFLDTTTVVRHIGNGLMINPAMFDFINPLLRHQPYIYDVKYLSEDKIPAGVLDLDKIRYGLLNLRAGNIKSYYYKIFGLVDYDDNGWLNQLDDLDDFSGLSEVQILVGRSTRYINQSIDYSYLADLGMHISFIGTDQEYNKFNELFPRVNANRLVIRNAVQVAQAIKKSKVYIGNQSLFFAIAESLNHPRLLESFEPVPNVIPNPGKSGSYITTSGMINMITDLCGLPNASSENSDKDPSFLLSY